MPDMTQRPEPVQPVDGTVVPRYAGFSTFARLPRIGDVPTYDVAVVGIPFDTGVSYRPGARFGPAHVRQCSRVLRPYHPQMEVMPFATQQVVDAGDIACTPFDIAEGDDSDRGAGERTHRRRRRGSSRSVATTRSPTRCCVRTTQSTGRWRWCTSTRTSTRGTPTSTLR